jgi:hypothetical protein
VQYLRHKTGVRTCICFIKELGSFTFAISFFLSSGSSSVLLFFPWKCILGFQAVKLNCDCTLGITGHSCLLPVFMFNYSCTSYPLRLWLSCTNSSSTEAVLPSTTQAQLCTINPRSMVSQLEVFSVISLLFVEVSVNIIQLPRLAFLSLQKGS